MHITPESPRLRPAASQPDIGGWPRLCLAEIWQPQMQPGGSPYFRRLLGAPDWQTLWPAINRLSVWNKCTRPVALTKYEGMGRQADLLVDIVNLGLPLPRLFSFEAVFTGATHRGGLPLLPALSLSRMAPLTNRLRRDWAELQAKAKGNLAGIGLLDNRGTVIEQPILKHDRTLDRDLWRREAEHEFTRQSGSESHYGQSARAAFMDMTVMTAADLAWRAIHKPVRADKPINAGVVAMLAKQKRDALAPATIIQLPPTRDARRMNRLVIIEPQPQL